jgi:hypothetical protein
VIIRRRHTKNFTTLSNVIFDDMKLQADEVGILAYLLSRPHDWEIRRSALMRRWSIGPGTMKRIVNSWMKAGWCQATKIRLPNGTFCILYDISDLPGKELSDDEIRMALSLVSSEVDPDGIIVASDPDEPPSIPDDPPPSQPVLVDHGGGEAGVAYRELPNTEQPRTDLDQNSERELARAREKHALNLVQFKRRYPTAASDDQTKIDEEWFKLEFDDADHAISGIVLFLEKLKRDKRTTVPAAWKYLKEKRWTLLDQSAANGAVSSEGYARDSTEGKAIRRAFEIAGKSDAFFKIYARGDRVFYFKPVTLRLLALADAPPCEISLTRQQAAAWEGLLRETLGELARRPLKEGSLAPWPWPPSAEGKVYTATGPPPETVLSEQDMADFH